MQVDKIKTRTQFAAELGISRKTLYNWTKQSGLVIKGRLLTAEDQKNILVCYWTKKDADN